MIQFVRLARFISSPKHQKNGLSRRPFCVLVDVLRRKMGYLVLDSKEGAGCKLSSVGFGKRQKM